VLTSFEYVAAVIEMWLSLLSTFSS